MINNAFTKGAYLFYQLLANKRNTDLLLSSLVNKLQSYNIKSVIDIGCGGGELTLRLANNGFIISGIDYAKEMIDIASYNDKDSLVEWNCKDFFNYHSKNKFDIGIAVYSFFQTLTSNDLRDDFFTKLKTIIIKGGYGLIEVQNKEVIQSKYPFDQKGSWIEDGYRVEAYSQALNKESYNLHFDIFNHHSDELIIHFKHKIFYMTREILQDYFNRNNIKALEWLDSKNLSIPFNEKVSEGIICIFQFN